MTEQRASESPGERITAEMARNMSGTFGDPVTAVEDLPGVVRPWSESDGIAIWGARPSDSRVLVDGLEVPALLHLGSLRSAVGLNTPDHVDLIPGTYGGAYGRALGGLVVIGTRDLPTQGTHAAAEANFADASLTASAALTSRLRFSVAGTWSYAEAAPDAFGKRPTVFYGSPRYRDFQAKTEFSLSAQRQLTALVIGATEHVDPSSDVFYSNNRWYPPHDRVWSRIALRYTDSANGTVVMPFVGWTNDDLNPDSLGTNNPAIGVRDERHLHALQYGIRASRDVQWSDNVVLTASLDGLIERTRASQRAGSSFPLRDEDVTSLVSGPGLPSFAYSTSDWISTVGDVAASLSLRWQTGRWTMVPAFRADFFPIFVEGGDPTQPTSISHWPVAWEPRLSITYAPHPAVDLHVAAGLYSQPPAAGDLSPDFGNPWLGPAHAGHASLGVRWRATASTTVDATGFFRQSWDMAVRSTQPTVTPGQFLVPDGRARAYGAQFIVRKQLTARLDAWLGYTIGRSEMRSGEAYTGWAFPSPNQSWTVAPQDRTHIVTGVFAYRWRGWLGSSRFRYTSGAPYTPVTGGFLSSSLDAYEPIYGAPNSGRMPAFMQADARIGRELHIGPSVGSLYFAVSNATSHHNGEAIIYSYNYTKSATVDAPLRSYLLGVRWQL